MLPCASTTAGYQYTAFREIKMMRFKFDEFLDATFANA